MTKMKILLYGQDEPLLHSRGLVLKSRGFDVDVTCDGRHLEQALAASDRHPAGAYLLLLCHSVPNEERQRLVKLTQRLHPRVGILQIVLPVQLGERNLHSNTVDASRGPETLIAAVEHSLSQVAALAH